MTQRVSVLTCALCIAAAAAVAQEKEDEPGWEFTALIGAEVEPAYVGSDEYVSELGAGFEAEYTARNGVTWSLGTSGFGASFDFQEVWSVALELEYEPGRESEDDPILDGFPIVEDTWELQAGLARTFGPYSLGATFQTDILGRGKGNVFFVGGAYQAQLSPRLGADVGLDFSFADSEHMNTEIGISQTTANRTGLAAYDAPGGYKGATLSLGMDYALSDRLTLIGDLSLETYGSAISDSPLVRDEGSDSTTELSIGLAFAF